MNGGPAFPRAGKEWGNQAWTEAMAEDGMTLRDYFAAKAMQGLVENANWRGMPEDALAKAAYSMADAMLKARKS
jgi:hypothetical protein